jgi:hypothetical protein
MTTKRFHSRTSTNHTASVQARDEKRAMAAKTIDEGIKSLVEEIKAGKTEHFQQWLQFAAQFHRYSAANMWLILGQCKERGIYASHIASYHAWEEMGYQVAKGQKAIWIWAPRPYTKEVENKNTHEKEEKSYTGFVLVPVFDASQIAQGINPETGQEYPRLVEFFAPLPTSEQARHLYEMLVQVATDEGFTCIEEARTDALQGWSQEKTICVKNGRDDLSTLNTFIHEYTHGLLHWDGVNYSKKQAEAEAESVAYIVAAHFGLSNPFSSDYLIQYGNDEKSLMGYMDRIRKTAHAIIEKLEKALNKSVEEVAA